MYMNQHKHLLDELKAQCTRTSDTLTVQCTSDTVTVQCMSDTVTTISDTVTVQCMPHTITVQYA
jgi:hypothetical protein